VYYRELARKFGVSEGTIRNRFDHMRSTGLLTGSIVHPNPCLLGVMMGAYGLEVSQALPKADVVNKLKLVGGVLVIQNHHGNFVGIVFLYEDDRLLKKKLALFRSIAGAEGGIFSRMRFPPCNVSLTSADWELVAQLAKGEFRSYKELAKEMKIPFRSLNRELSRVVGGGAVFTIPRLDYSAMKGAVPADVMVLFKTAEAREAAETKILELIDDFMFYAGIWTDQGLYSLILPNALIASELTRKVAQIGGVEMVRTELVDDHIDQPEIFEYYIARQMTLLRGSQRRR